jgi:RNA polymerase sigma-70 factor (ECF subfamily)
VNLVDDNFLVQQTLQGNKNAFRFLVLRYQKPIFKILGTLIYDSAQVEEIAQETFLRAYKSLSSFDASLGASFSTWLFTIARNLAFNALEKRKVRQANQQVVEQLQGELQEELQQRADASDPSEEFEKRRKSGAVREAIEKLPADFRLAVVLSCLEGHSITEIAQIEGCSEGTVKSRIFRGKQQLRKLLIPILGENYENGV